MLDKFESYFDTVVCGTAQGADNLGAQYGRDHEKHVIYFEPEWEKHGKSAGYLRNKDMAAYGDMLILFWDGESKGSQHMLNIAREESLFPIIVFYHKKEK